MTAVSAPEVIQRHEVDVHGRGEVADSAGGPQLREHPLGVHGALGQPVLPEVYRIMASRWSVSPV